MVLALAYTCIFGAGALLAWASYAPLAERAKGYVDQRVRQASEELGEMFVNLTQARLRLWYVAAPLLVGLVCWMAGGSWLMGIVGLGLGVMAPRLALRQMGAARARKFHGQFVDSLLLLSSSLRAGLSMTQSFAVIAEEMPPPIADEFGLLLKETRMGVNVDEALQRLRQRMPSDDTMLFVTAVLVARETGGDVTAIFSQLVETLRERKRLRERIKTLTFMARMQGLMMAALPFLFAYAVYTMDKNHFVFFLHDEVGKLMILLIAACWLVGAVLFARFGRSPL